MANAKTSKNWPVKATDPPKLTQQQWNFTMALGFIFVAAALLQIISFNDFTDTLSSMGLSSTGAWGGALIFLELWAAAGFFKVPLSNAFRMASSLFAILISGFWFFETLHLVSADMTSLHSSAFFGKYLSQSPGWWTVIEITILLVWTLWAVSLTKPKSIK